MAGTGTGITSKADLCLVYNIYEPGIGTDIR